MQFILFLHFFGKEGKGSEVRDKEGIKGRGRGEREMCEGKGRREWGEGSGRGMREKGEGRGAWGEAERGMEER